MLNHQRPTGPRVTDGQTLLVHSIFPTIQGEGPFAGHPALFIRLADCNLQCPLCDTDYTGGLGEMSVPEIVEQVEIHQLPLVVITGGEPFRQNISPLIASLSWHVAAQVETNGFMCPQGEAWRIAHIVVSPKTHRIDPKLAEAADAYKYVLSAGDVAEDGLPRSALGHPLPVGTTIARPPVGYKGKVYVQPADHKDPAQNKANLIAAMETVMATPEYILGVQMHKIIGVE